MIIRAQGRNPGRFLYELEVFGAIEVEDQRERNHEPEQGRNISPELDRARVRRRDEQQDSKPASGVKSTMERMWSIRVGHPY